MRNITPDSYLWTRLSPEKILHSSKQRDSKVYQVHDLRVSVIYSQASAEKVRHRTRHHVDNIQLYTHMHTPNLLLFLLHAHSYTLINTRLYFLWFLWMDLWSDIIYASLVFLCFIQALKTIRFSYLLQYRLITCYESILYWIWVNTDWLCIIPKHNV